MVAGIRRIGILTGGGDVPGLNSVIKSVVYNATEIGCEVIGIRRGWAGLIDVIRAIRGVRLAVFFEELPDGKVRVSMRSKDRKLDVCKIATAFGGGG